MMRLVEAGVCAVVVLGFGVLALAYRDRRNVHLPDQLAALLSMLVGVAFGMLWELVEFILDWVASTDFQPTNTSTMLDLLASDVAAVIGAVLATRLYCRSLTVRQRGQLGDLAAWLADGPNQVLHEHGFAMTLAVSAVVVAVVAGLWFAGRPVPGFPIS